MHSGKNLKKSNLLPQAQLQKFKKSNLLPQAYPVFLFGHQIHDLLNFSILLSNANNAMAQKFLRQFRNTVLNKDQELWFKLNGHTSTLKLIVKQMSGDGDEQRAKSDEVFNTL